MLTKAGFEVLIPKELADVLEAKIHAAYTQGLPIQKAIMVGIQAFNEYWEKYYADKSGG